MSDRRLTRRGPWLALLPFATACSSSSSVATALSFTSVNPWDGGPDAGCVIGTRGVRVGCATAYPITGDPYTCAGFDEAGTGGADTCKIICSSGLVCSVAGVSDGTNAVDCSANCASPER